jgi:hypothetical protein
MADRIYFHFSSLILSISCFYMPGNQAKAMPLQREGSGYGSEPMLIGGLDC